MTRERLPASPYKGLAAFEASDLDALFFFGRERDSQIIAANLIASRLTVLFGPTGVGKTSVLRAGVACQLRREAGVEVVIHSSWTGPPGDALSSAAQGTAADVYLILDQFEEFFLYHQHDRTFVEGLAELVGPSSPGVNVLIGIREDSLAQLDSFKAVIPSLLSNRLNLQRLDRNAGRSAILGPVRRFNELAAGERHVEVEPVLVEAVLDEVAAGRVELGTAGRGVVTGRRDTQEIEAPYLQLVMARIWEVETESGSDTLRRETLRELGGATQIVQDHLERAMDELTPRQKDAAAAMYRFLVTPSGTKIAHGVSDLAGYAEIDERDARNVLKRLADERIVRASAENGAATRYEIYHDVLADAVVAWRNRHGSERALHEAERRRRRALFVATAALAGVLLIGAIAVYALLERSDARTQARRANARQLAAEADLQLPIDPLESIGLGIRAARLDDTPETERVLRDALQGSYVRRVFRAPDPVAAASGPLTAFGDSRGRLLLFPTERGVTRSDELGGPITALALSRDGGTLAAGVGSAVVVSSNGETSRLPLFGAPTAVAVDGDGTHLAAGLEDGTVLLLRPRPHRLHVRGSVASFAFSPDLRFLLVTSKDRRARLLDARSGRVVRVLSHEGFVHASTFSPNGRLVVTGSADYTARIWDVRNGRLLHVLATAVGGILAVAFSPDGHLVGVGSSDGIARVYDARTGTRLVLLNGHATAVTAIGFSHDGKTIVTGSTDRTARIWVTDTGRLLRTLTGHADTVTAAFFTAGGTQTVTAGSDGTVRVWDPGTAPELRPVIRQSSPITSLAASSDGSRLLVGDAGGRMRVWSVSGRRFVRTVRAGRQVSAVTFGPAGPLAVPEPVRAVAYSSAAGLIATAGAQGVRVRGPGSPRLRGSSGEMTSVAFSPDGDLLAAGAADGTLRLWDPRTGKVRRTLRGHAAEVLSVAFSPGGEKLVSGSRDGDARLWDFPTGTVTVLRSHGGPVFDANFSSDGQWVVTAGPITAGIWSVATGRLAFLLDGHGPVIRAALFAPNSLRIFTAGDDGTVRTYDCVVCRPTGGLVRAAQARLAAARPR